jgi:hypothetical protein
VEDKPISVAERLLTKTPSFERKRHATASTISRKETASSEDTPNFEYTEQRLSPFGARKMYTVEKTKWIDDDEDKPYSIHDEAAEIHRAIHALRLVKIYIFKPN